MNKKHDWKVTWKVRLHLFACQWDVEAFLSPPNFCLFLDNFYGTPKPPAEPTPMLFNVTDQLLPGARPSAEGKRKRNKSVSNMEKDSIEPPEEEEEESPVVNGNGIAITPGYYLPLLPGALFQLFCCS